MRIQLQKLSKLQLFTYKYLQMKSQQQEQSKVFRLLAQKLLEQLPIKQSQINAIIHSRISIPEWVSSFDPQCSLLKMEMFIINKEAIIKECKLFGRRIIQEIQHSLPILNIQNPPSFQQFMIMIAASVPIENGTNIIERLKDRNLSDRQFCLQLFTIALQQSWAKLLATYESNLQEKQLTTIIKSLKQQLISKLNAQKHISNEKPYSQLKEQYNDIQKPQKSKFNMMKLFKRNEDDKTNLQNKKSQGFRGLQGIRLQQQKNLLKIKHESVLKQMFHNLSHNKQLKVRQINQINEIMRLSQFQLNDNAEVMLNNKNVEDIKHILRWNLINWEQKAKSQGMGVKLAQENYKQLIETTQKLQFALNTIKNCSGHSNNYLYLVAIFYETLRKSYSPPIKRFLMKNLQTIELAYNQSSGSYLRGALSRYQLKDINPSKVAKLLSQKKPQGSQIFKESNESKIKQEASKFLDQKLVDNQIKQQLNKIHEKMKQEESIFESPPVVFSFVKMSLSQIRKTVTIMISGFLSQKRSMDTEWTNMIHALPDSQIYALRWQSGTIMNLLGEIAAKIVNFRSKADTFGNAFKEAEKAGIYLAQFLIEHFSDRFINLVGFSLGTRVIYCCLKRLLKKKKINLMNRIITLGGVAARDQFQQLLRRAQYPLDVLNLRSDKDATLSKILYFWNNAVQPIGLYELRAIPGHTIRDVDLTTIVKGHLKYKNQQYLIGKMGDIIHD